MLKFSRTLLGSRLDIKIIPLEWFSPDLIEDCFGRVFAFEEKYSRFKKGNWLDVLNKTGSAEIDQEAKTLLSFAKKISKLSEGNFDMTVRGWLENRGYGIETEKISENRGMDHVEITENRVILHNGVTLDFGGLGKGYAIDVVFNRLKPFAEKLVVNFGGDIRIKGSERVFLEDPVLVGKNLWYIDMTDMAIAASSGSKRQFSDHDHLVSFAEREIVGTYVMHSSALFADVFATALIVSPLALAEKLLRETPWIRGCLVEKNGSIYRSPLFQIIWNKHA